MDFKRVKERTVCENESYVSKSSDVCINFAFTIIIFVNISI